MLLTCAWSVRVTVAAVTSERQRGNANQAVLAVARKLVAHLLAVDRRNGEFIAASESKQTAAA